jgi:hypothetical protein
MRKQSIAIARWRDKRGGKNEARRMMNHESNEDGGFNFWRSCLGILFFTPLFVAWHDGLLE